jgi:replicative DNA helicase
MENKITLKQLESELAHIEKECEASDQEWQFKNALAEYRGEDQIVSFKDWLNSNKEKKIKSFKVGLVGLDDITGGFHKGDLITITGETGNGKTSFAQYLTIKFAEQEMKSLWFSYELPVLNFLNKFQTLPDGYLPKVLSERSPIWIERKIVEGIVKFGIQCVFIDHLHYLFDMALAKNISLEIGEIMRTLKLIAKKYNIAIFIMAHTGKSREDGTVGIDNIRDSSFVAQESDYVIAVWREKEKMSNKDIAADGIRYKPTSKVFVAKNRYTGRIASITCDFKEGIYKEVAASRIPTQEEVDDEIIVNQQMFEK